MSKKSISILMSIVLVVGLCPLPAYAGNGADLAVGSVAELSNGEDESTSSPYDGLLEELNRDVADAQSRLEVAQQNKAEAQVALDKAQADLDAADDGSMAEAQRVEAEKKAERDAALTAKEQAATALTQAEQALSDNQAAIVSAQEEYDAAVVAQSSSEIVAARQAYEAAEADYAEKQAIEQAAQAQVDEDEAAGVPTENVEAWTSLGLFKYIRDNAQEGSNAYWDAQCAIDILTSGTNTTGHVYHVVNGKDQEGPVPNGVQASSWMNISDNVSITDRNDAVSLNNFKTALDYVDEYNQHRARENSEEGYSLDTNIGINCRLMAIAEVQLDTSKDSSVGHTQAYYLGENLSWGYTDPFTGWYDREKNLWKNGSTSGVGHYMNIVDQLPEGSENPTKGTGFAVHTNAPTYGVAHGQVFYTTSGYDAYNPLITYSTSEFKSLYFDAYYQTQIEAGMNGVTEAKKAEHRQALAEAQQAAATSKQQRDSAKTTYDGLVAAAAQRLEAAQQALEQLQSQTPTLQQDVADKQAASDAANAQAQAAQDAYEAAQQNTQDVIAQYGERVEQLTEERDRCKAALDAADAALQNAQSAVATAQDRLDSAGNLEESVEVTIGEGPFVNPEGYLINPMVIVKKTFEGDVYTLNEPDHYCVKYDYGSGEVVIWGVGEKGDGTTWSSTTQDGLGKAAIDRPRDFSCVYDGTQRIPYQETPGYTLEGETWATVVGSYNVTATLNDGYMWDDGSTDSLSLFWEIVPASISEAKIGAIEAQVYTGKPCNPSITVTLDGMVIDPSDYKVVFFDSEWSEVLPENVKDAGTYNIRVEGVNNYTGTVEQSATFTIEEAPVVTGWQKVDGKWYYYDADGAMATNKWVKDSKGWCYLGADGAMATNKWVKDSKGWCYVGTDGYAVADKWVKDSKGWCYLDSNCHAVASAWKKVSGKWYYFDSAFHMLTGWQKVSSKWYYLGTNGAMTTGWQKVSGSWYYMNASGVMQTGWQKISDKWYYLGTNGKMVTGTQVIGGKTYKFNNSGVWIG